jgi:F-type H+-transporting ATPase subunit a
MKVKIFGDTEIWQLGPVPLTHTMMGSTLVSITLLCLAFLMSRAIRSAPESRSAAATALVFQFLTKLVREAAGRSSYALEVFAGTLFLFISGCTVLGQFPGLEAPTADLFATSALAMLVFLAVPLAGIFSKGLRGYLHHYLSPNPLLLPLHIISEFSRTLALMLRLFGNMMSGQLVVAIIVGLVGVIVPVPLMALDMLIGFLQAYIFTILACVYIGAAIRIEEARHD